VITGLVNNSRFLNREVPRSNFNARDLGVLDASRSISCHAAINTLDLKKTTNSFFPINFTIGDSVFLPFDSVTHTVEKVY
jgi:hypothetical protein